MKGIVLVCQDGAAQFAILVPADFDTRKWWESRKESMGLLGVVRVVEQDRGEKAESVQ